MQRHRVLNQPCQHVALLNVSKIDTNISTNRGFWNFGCAEKNLPNISAKLKITGVTFGACKIASSIWISNVKHCVIWPPVGWVTSFLSSLNTFKCINYMFKHLFELLFSRLVVTLIVISNINEEVGRLSFSSSLISSNVLQTLG